MKNNRIALLNCSKNSVINEFANRLGIEPMEIIRHNKCSEISDVRHLYCKLRYDRHGLSYSELARELGRSPSTVRYGVIRINNLLLLNDKKIVAMWKRVRDISELYPTGTNFRIGLKIMAQAARADLQSVCCEAESN